MGANILALQCFLFFLLLMLCLLGCLLFLVPFFFPLLLLLLLVLFLLLLLSSFWFIPEQGTRLLKGPGPTSRGGSGPSPEKAVRKRNQSKTRPNDPEVSGSSSKSLLVPDIRKIPDIPKWVSKVESGRVRQKRRQGGLLLLF